MYIHLAHSRQITPASESKRKTEKEGPRFEDPLDFTYVRSDYS